MVTDLRRLLAFFRRDRLDDELAEEIRLHLELRRRALIDDGMAPATPNGEARRQFGNVTVDPRAHPRSVGQRGRRRRSCRT